MWLLSLGFVCPSSAQDPFAESRRQMVEKYIVGAGVKDPRVVTAMLDTPRHEFLPAAQRDRAYFDMALPIGSSQTISSPFIVASMTEALDPQPTDVVLEIGTGSGYQAAVLSPLVKQVYTIEIVPELGKTATETLQRLGYKNVSTRVGDGFKGWPDAAPFDKIIVTCSPEDVPQPLVDQLREGGRIIIPVGERYQQTLYRMSKRDGKLVREALQPTLFVPMTGEAESVRTVQPDPQNPRVVNGDFEQQPAEPQTAEAVPGWYYGRQVQQVETPQQGNGGSRGKSFARFSNETPGLGSHLLQGIPIDGQTISMIRLGAQVRTQRVLQGPTQEALPMIAISLYDKDRRELGMYWLGPYRGTTDWRRVTRLIRVPPATREAILRIGLFGATGVADFDQISIEKIE
jgi:protein-L-isoaspartate(D-aspartate) O-methyltransferase